MWRWSVLGLVLGFLAACSGGALVERGVDPLSVTPPSSPNWALAAAPEAGVAAAPTRSAPIFSTGPEELLAALDAVATGEPRTEPVASGVTDRPARAYVQRSATFGFPDVVSVVAIDLGAGDAGQRSTLALYSRSVYGYSDLGVNAARLDRWIERLSETTPIVAGRD